MGIAAAVSFNEDNNKYLVYVDERYNSRKEAKSQLSAIKANQSYEDASLENIQNYSLYLGEKEERAMNFSFQIRIDDQKDELDEGQLKSLIIPGSRTELEKSTDGSVLFKGLTSWTRTKALQQKLADIPEIEHPITILVEK